MNFREAAYKILKRKKKPLRVKEITKIALDEKLIETSGKTPSASIGAGIYTDIKDNREKSVFIKTDRGEFGLREWGTEIIDKNKAKIELAKPHLIMQLEETKALKEVENSLRDFISVLMKEEKGDNWLNSCGISPDRIIKWKERREIEKKKQKFGTPEDRLLYFSDFYDLSNIIEKNWHKFENALGEKKTILVFLKILNDYRDHDAHRRELLPHQKHLIIGISGEIRNRIVLYRSKKETGEDYFPRIESVRDNLGNLWIPGKGSVYNNLILRPKDKITFIITATDPLGESLEYCCHGKSEWQENNTINIEINNKHIGKKSDFMICIRSKREYHASGTVDDRVIFSYTILPKK